MGKRSRFAVASTLASALFFACGETGAPPAPATRAPNASFALHEWGLIAINPNTQNRAFAATSIASAPLPEPSHEFGTIGSGGKPVIYVHLDPGTDEARFDLRLGVPSARLLERWPIGGALDPRAAETAAGFRNVVARRGGCTTETPAPTPSSPACAAPSDGFCEAAEIPRYTGDRASCLHVDDTTSEVLFYRTDGLRVPELPLRLLNSVDEVQVRHTRRIAIEGPVFLIRATHPDVAPHIERLESGDFDVPRPMTTDTLTPNDVRMALTDEAVKRGLTTQEAEAFVDAWAPAYFDIRRRTGPEASGVVPTALAQGGVSLLYFASTEMIDAMIPLSTSPPAREIRRVFLVRWVDGRSIFHQPLELGTIGHGGGSGSAYTPCREARCPRVRVHTEPEVTPGLAPVVIRRVMQRHVGVLRYCFERGLASRPELEGWLTLAFVIGRNGLVSSTQVATSTLNERDVERCVANATQRMAFPTPEPSANVRVRQRLDFVFTSPDE